MIDLRFPTALQMMLSLAVAAETNRQCTSRELAIGLGANPSLVRKLLVPLGRDNMVTSALGKNGGIRLGRPADQITLREVYRSITEEKRVFVARPDVPCVCVVSTNIGKLFEVISEEAEDAVLTALDRRTVANSLMEIRKIDLRN